MKKKIALIAALAFVGVAWKTLCVAAPAVPEKAPAAASQAAAAPPAAAAPSDVVPPAPGVAPEEEKAPVPDAAELEKLRMNAEEAKKIVVAKVNDATISMLELVRMMNRVAPKYVKEGEEISPEITVKIKKDALDRLILDELAVQQSYTQKLTIEKKTIDEVISNVQESLGSEEAFKQYLAGRNLTEEQLRKEIERSRRRELIMAREVYGKVKVKEEDIKKEYEQYKKDGRLRKKDDYLVKEVLLMKGAGDEAEKKRAEELLAEIKKNNGDMGKLVLDGTFITRRMEISKDRYPLIYEKMGKMKVDEMSDVVKDGGSYHIFTVLKNEPARDMTVDESRGFIENRLRVPAQDARKIAWEKELRQNAKVEILLEKVEKELQEKAEKDEKAGKAEPKKK